MKIFFSLKLILSYESRIDFNFSLPLATRDSLERSEARVHASSIGGNPKDCPSSSKDETEESSKYIYGVLWACLFMLMWKHTWIVHLLPIPIAVYFVKHIGK